MKAAVWDRCYKKSWSGLSSHARLGLNNSHRLNEDSVMNQSTSHRIWVVAVFFFVRAFSVS